MSGDRFQLAVIVGSVRERRFGPVVADWFAGQAKPVGFVSYGGLSGGLRAVEPLRVVFAELNSVTIRNTVSFHQAGEQFDEHGSPRHPEGVNAAAGALLDQLAWWAWSLQEARSARPYVA
ncbi:MAG: hypothetical protein GEU83_20575 [Pseudonocardiaceae bacterium]|nr:hypothetical protein [Pseudonocardiaceae bacterium]